MSSQIAPSSNTKRIYETHEFVELLQYLTDKRQYGATCVLLETYSFGNYYCRPIAVDTMLSRWPEMEVKW